MTKIELFRDPENGEIYRATFDSVNGFGRRVKHYIIRSQFVEGYVHISRSLVLDEHCNDIELGADSETQVSERVFFGKYRLMQIFEEHRTETWLAIAEIVKLMER